MPETLVIDRGSCAIVRPVPGDVVTALPGAHAGPGPTSEQARAAAEQGLGEQAYSAPDGALVAVRDDVVLDVDATALPEDLGPGHQRRIELACLLAAGVFACWTGES
jgi:hypothetical protein